MGRRTNTAAWLPNQKRWQIKVQKDGERRTFTSAKPGRTGQREANAKADAWLDDGIQSQNQRVDKVYTEFLEHKHQTTSFSNWRPMQGRWINYVEPLIGRKYVSALTERDLQRVIDHAFSSRGLSRKSLTNLRTDLCSFAKYCRVGRLSTLFPESLTIPSAATSSEKKVLQPNDLAVLFRSEETTWRDCVVPEALIHAYRLAVLTGLRPGELMGLQWGDVKPDRLELRRSINRYSETTSGKNKNARRVVELSGLARQELAAQRQQCGIPSPSDPVFDIPSGKYLEDHLARYCRHNGITGVTPYELRHTFVSVAKTLPVGLVKSLVGHSRSMDTYGVYGHELQGDSSARTDALDSVFDRLLDAGRTK